MIKKDLSEQANLQQQKGKLLGAAGKAAAGAALKALKPKVNVKFEFIN